MSDVYYEDMSDDFLAERTTGWFKEANERALQARRLVSLLGELAVRLNNPSSNDQSHQNATRDHYQGSVPEPSGFWVSSIYQVLFTLRETLTTLSKHTGAEMTNYAGGSGSSVEQQILILSPPLPIPLHMDEDYRPPKRRQRFECWYPWHFVSSVTDEMRTELSEQGVNAVVNFTEADDRAVRRNILCEHRCKPSNLRICWTFLNIENKL